MTAAVLTHTHTTAPAPHSPPLEFSSPPSSPPTPGLLSFLPDLPLNLPKLGLSGLTRDREPRCRSPPPSPAASAASSASSGRYAPLSHPLSSAGASSSSSAAAERDVECGDCLPLPLPLGAGKPALSRSSVGRYARTLQHALRSPARNPLLLRDELDMATVLLVMFNVFVWSRYFFA